MTGAGEMAASLVVEIWWGGGGLIFGKQQLELSFKWMYFNFYNGKIQIEYVQEGMFMVPKKSLT